MKEKSNDGGGEGAVNKFAKSYPFQEFP